MTKRRFWFTTAANRPDFAAAAVEIRASETAKARATDPVASHAAAEVASLTLKQVRFAVLWLVNQEPASTGKEINDLYRTLQPKLGWPVVDGDSPRRRAGELARDGYLERAEQEQARNNRPVGHYTITERGAKAMENWT